MKALRPYLQRYIELRGSVVVPAEFFLPDHIPEPGTWVIVGGKPKPGWTDDDDAVEAVAIAAGLNPGDYGRREIDTEALAKAPPELMNAIAMDFESALKAVGQDSAGFIRQIPNTAALDETLKQPKVFDLLKTRRVEKKSKPTLRFKPVAASAEEAAASLLNQ